MALGYTDYSVAAQEDASFFNPPFLSPAFFYGGIPHYWALKGVTILTCLSAILALVGYRSALCSVVFSVSLVTGLSFVFSFGKVDHGEVFIPIVALLGACCDWGKNSKAFLSSGAFYFLVACAIALAFFTAGLPKLLSGWLNPSDQHFKYVLINASFGLEKSNVGKWCLEHVQSNLIWELLDWLAVFFELGLIVLILRPRWFQVGLLMCVGFHLLNLLLLGISFSHAMIVYLMFLPLSRVRREHYPVLVIFAMLALSAVTMLTESSINLASLLDTLRQGTVWIPLTGLSYVLLFVLTREKHKSENPS